MRSRTVASIPVYTLNTLYKHSLRNGGRICDIYEESGITVPLELESKRSTHRINHNISKYVPFDTAHNKFTANSTVYSRYFKNYII